jgi:hypothetical protein
MPGQLRPASLPACQDVYAAGKTTLMRMITGQEFPTSGTVRVFGQVPAESDAVLRRMVFVREEQPYPDFRVAHAVRVESWFYPNWIEELAGICWLASAFRCGGGSGSCRAECAPPSGSPSSWRPAPS